MVDTDSGFLAKVKLPDCFYLEPQDRIKLKKFEQTT
jgi:hypothetical protein